jgi:hypothetical protein
MKILKYLPTFCVLFLLTGCTISHTYGPYSGKVIDLETGEPIEGAVVFVQFFTEGMLSPGGVVSSFADAVEVLTDSNGEFEIPAQKIKSFKMFSRWAVYESVIIFKPGYGAYPKHPGIVRDLLEENHFLPTGKYVTIKLPQLRSREERKKFLSHAGAYDPTIIPYEKQKNILNLYNSERISLGLEPVMTRMGNRGE